jgi:dTDP-4-amino-4,6-dideoxygalactose transaminase
MEVLEMTNLPIFNLPLPILIPQVPKISDWIDLLDQSYKSNSFTNSGPLAVLAETALNDYLGDGIESMVCSSNTSGLIASLIALDLQGKKVIVSNNTFAATLHALISVGCLPIIADVNPLTWEIDTESVAAILEEHEVGGLLFTRVHGFRRDITPLLDMCESLSIKVLIDSAAAFPVRQNEYTNPIKYLEVFSFHATKPLGIGEGGAVIGPPKLISEVRKASNFGLIKPSSTFGDGINAKMDEFASARLIAGLMNFQDIAMKRVEFVNSLSKLFRLNDLIQTAIDTGNTSWAFFPIVFSSEDDLIFFQNEMKAVIQTRRYYYPSLAKGYSGRAAIQLAKNLSVSENLTVTTLCLPVIPTIDSRSRFMYFNHLTKTLSAVKHQSETE